MIDRLTRLELAVGQIELAIAELFEQLTDPDVDPPMTACRAIRAKFPKHLYPDAPALDDDGPESSDPTTPGTLMVPSDALDELESVAAGAIHSER